MPTTRDFQSAARDTLRFLHDRLGFGLWMVTRVDGDDWIVLAAEDHGYSVTKGTLFRWQDSFCSRMIEGQGPRIAPDSDQIPSYLTAPIGRQVPIRAYIGEPLLGDDGSVFGTLCAIDPSPQPEAIVAEGALVGLLAGLLSQILSAELEVQRASRRTELAEAELLRDSLTFLYGRRGWDQLMASEEERCARYGHPAAVLSIDLDDLKRVNDTLGHAAGDALLVRAGAAISRATRPFDVVARVGGDEFAILAPECNADGATALLERLEQALTQAGISASIGVAGRHPSRDLVAAWEDADAAMYRAKRRAKSLRCAPTQSIEAFSHV